MSDSVDLRQRRANGARVPNGNGLQKPKSRTLSWTEIPQWQRDNDYILTGYRHVQNSWSGCIASVFGYLHNETVNIHSHFIGAILFLFFIATFNSTYINKYPEATWMDTTVFAIFLSSAVFCLVCSATYHMITCHSEAVSDHCHAFDYAGIVTLTVGSFFPCLFYGFYCQPYLQALYLSGITLTGMGAAYIVLDPEYGKPTHRGARTKVFIGLGLSAVFPITHLVVSHGVGELFSEMGFGWLLLSGGFYIVGALLYANRIPERLAPGKFDYFFASHQIFHVCVVLAALAHYVCVLTGFNHWHSGAGICR